jgi:TolB protein
VLLGLGIAVVAAIGALVIVRGGRPIESSAPSVATIVALDRFGALALVDSSGHSTVLASDADITYGFPAWSPDGSRLALIAEGASDTSISIVPAHPVAAAPSPPPTLIYRSAAAPPFYLSWSPDGRKLSFLANEPSEVSLRIAPADGGAPVDGSGLGAIIRKGAPLYFDWIGTDRMLLHVGTGPTAFLGEVGLDGTPAAPTLASPGDFRPAVVSADSRYLAYARSKIDGPGEVVVSTRDGAPGHALTVLGAAAMVFDPRSDRVAFIAANEPGQTELAFPVGPLRVVDADSGVPRTLIDGSVVAFFWSPDGRTLAALLLKPASGGTTAGIRLAVAGASRSGLEPIAAAAEASSSPAAAPSATLEPSATVAPSQRPDFDVHLAFVDVASGAIRSDRVLQPGRRFVSEILPYFDQYALSHRLWAPDGSSFLMPIVTSTGTTELVALSPDGGEPLLTIEGEIGFWSP